MTSVASADAPPPDASRWRPGEVVFAIGFAVAAAITAIGIYLTVGAPDRPSADAPVNLLWLLGLNLLLILPLGGAVAWRALRVKVQGEAGARLHLRFVTLFALAALIPALVAAIFFGLLVTQGVDRWFGERVRVAVESSANVARAYQQSQQRALVGELQPIEVDVRRNGPAWRTDPSAYADFLRRELEAHLIDGVYIVDGEGRQLARYELTNPPPYLTFPPASVSAARGGEIVVRFAEVDNLVRGLIRIDGSPNLYVSVVRRVGDLNQLVQASNALQGYRQAQRDREAVQVVFALIYIETALLVIIAAMWLGTNAARSVSEPIGRVVQAAERVASGDLDARVAIGRDPEAIVVLSRTFNRMTGDLRAQQQALRAAGEEAETRSRFIETVLSDVSAGVIGLDSERRVNAVNRQALMLLAADEAIGRTLGDIAPELERVAERARDSGDEAEEEMEIVRPSGARRIRARASVREDGGAVVTFDDITRLVAAQRNEAWKDVARRIAHEIKNPLTPIQLSAERLRRKYRSQITGDVETFDRCTDTIVRQVGDIGRMVDEFSAFARMPTPKFEDADAAEMLRQAVFSQRVAVADVPVDLTLPDGPVHLTCDERMVGQALTNVLKNAGEAVGARRLRDGNEGGGIRAALRPGGTYITIEIEDDGVGLPAAERNRLTEPYVTTREKGTGLGLAIVKRILEDHGGELTLGDAATGGGARAILRLPRRASIRVAPQAAETGVIA